MAYPHLFSDIPDDPGLTLETQLYTQRLQDADPPMDYKFDLEDLFGFMEEENRLLWKRNNGHTENISPIVKILADTTLNSPIGLKIESLVDKDVYGNIQFKTGETDTHRSYLEWLDYNGTRRGLLGWNAVKSFIVYNSEYTYHPIMMSPSGNSAVNSYGPTPLYINRDELATGTGGLSIQDGAPAATSETLATINQVGITSYGGRYLRTYNSNNTKFTSFFTDDNYGYLLSTNDLYFNTNSDDIWFAKSFGLKSRMKMQTSQFGLWTISPTEALDIGSGNLRIRDLPSVDIVGTDSAGVLIDGSAKLLWESDGFNAAMLKASNRNLFLTEQAGKSNTTGNYNVFAGHQAGRDNTTGSYNVSISYLAGRVNNGNQNIFIGSGSGMQNSSGSDNIMLGYLSGYNNIAGSKNIFLGYNAGLSETGSNKLYIDYSGSSAPLIYGEFDNNLLRINGELEITDLTGGTPGNFLARSGNQVVDSGYDINDLLSDPIYWRQSSGQLLSDKDQIGTLRDIIVNRILFSYRTTGTTQSLVGRDNSGYLSQVTIGSGLSFNTSTGTLSSTISSLWTNYTNFVGVTSGKGIWFEKGLFDTGLSRGSSGDVLTSLGGTGYGNGVDWKGKKEIQTNEYCYRRNYSAETTVASGTTNIPFNSLVKQVGGFTTSSQTVTKVPSNGWYEITFTCVLWDTGVNSSGEISLIKGTTVQQPHSQFNTETNKKRTHSVTWVAQFNTTDDLKIQSNAANLYKMRYMSLKINRLYDN